VGCNQSSVHYIIKKERECGSVRDKKIPGRKRKTTSREDRALVRLSLSNRKKTAPALKAALHTSLGINLSPATVKRRLCEAGLNGCVTCHKPLVTVDHKKCRMQYAEEHVSWTSEVWSKVLWSNESRFCLYQNDGRVYVRR
jgi:hypothetical protein